MGAISWSAGYLRAHSRFDPSSCMVRSGTWVEIQAGQRENISIVGIIHWQTTIGGRRSLRPTGVGEGELGQARMI